MERLKAFSVVTAYDFQSLPESFLAERSFQVSEYAIYFHAISTQSEFYTILFA